MLRKIHAVLQTDDSTTYSKLGDLVAVNGTELSSTEEGKFNLKWAHTAISNLKSELGKYRMISERKTQNYLDEFCYKLNRRYVGKNFLIASLLQQSNPTGNVAANHKH